MKLINKKILITGASSDIGITLINMLKDNNNVMGLFNNNPITNITSYKCNICNEDEIINIFNKIGNIDILINLASLSIDNDIYDKSKDEFLKVIETNILGTYLMCKNASLHMDKGIIINMSSTDGIDTYNPYSLDYSCSKAAINNLTKNLSLRFDNIKICALAPNYINTKSVLEMNKEFLNNELKRINQKELIKKENVCKKIIEIIENDSIKSGSIIRMDDNNE